MWPQGWHRHPHPDRDERWVPGGWPTNPVRDQTAGSHDERYRDWLPEWRWWTVCLPGLLALAVSGALLLYVGLGSLACADGCLPVTGGRPAGTAGEVIVAISAVGLLVAGLTMPEWRRATAAALWVALAIAGGSAALITTARPIMPADSYAQPSAPALDPSLDTAACTAIGGKVVDYNATCFGVPFIGHDGQRDYGAVSYGAGGRLTGPAEPTGTSATRAECESGKYPDRPTRPVTQQPGHWDAQLTLCLP